MSDKLNKEASIFTDPIVLGLAGLLAGGYIGHRYNQSFDKGTTDYEETKAAPIVGAAVGGGAGALTGWALQPGNPVVESVENMYDEPMPGERRKMKRLKKMLYGQLLPGYHYMDETMDNLAPRK